jgi:hypothetical protein
MAIIDNETYQTYAFYKAGEVPLEKLKILITVFINYAARNLGSKVEKADVDQIIEFIRSPQFNFLLVNIIASGFIRGSLGKLKNEKTTLTPRNIYDWLTEVSLEYRQQQEHNEREKRLSLNNPHFDDLIKYPLGKAICKKTDWLASGAITEEQYDQIPLKEVAELIGKGIIPTLKYFGIENNELITKT